MASAKSKANIGKTIPIPQTKNSSVNHMDLSPIHSKGERSVKEQTVLKLEEALEAVKDTSKRHKELVLENKYLTRKNEKLQEKNEKQGKRIEDLEKIVSQLMSLGNGL